MTSKGACIYTALIGDYETLNEIPIHASTEMPCICFTDNPALTSETWIIRHVKPTFPMDSPRSQRNIKILAHEYLPEFSSSLYIDNSVILRQNPESFFQIHLQNYNISTPNHSHRESILDEFIEVAKGGWDDPARIFEQLNHYQLINPAILQERPYWCGMLLRHHHHPDVRRAMVIWYNHVMRYSRRDQLSFNMAMNEANIDVGRIDIDNLHSSIHDWPIIANRISCRNSLSFALSSASTDTQVRSIQVEYLQVSQELAEIKSSKHWKLVSFWRFLRGWVGL